jgi:hypothetical protein
MRDLASQKHLEITESHTIACPSGRQLIDDFFFSAKITNLLRIAYIIITNQTKDSTSIVSSLAPDVSTLPALWRISTVFMIAFIRSD